MTHAPHPQPPWLVACLCAAWCGTCRDYRAGFEALGSHYPDAHFLWVDVEDDADWAGDLDVENFPTLLIQREDWVLYYGVMLPHHSHLQKLLDSLRTLGPEAAAAYASGNADRLAWQAHCNLRRLLSTR